MEDDRHSPLAPDEEMKENLRPRNPESEPHDIWIRFIQARFTYDVHGGGGDTKKTRKR